MRESPARRRSRRKGKAHPDAYSPERTLDHARLAWENGWLVIDARVYDQLVAMQVPLAEARTAIDAALREISAADAKPPDFAFDPPGQGFVWQSEYFGCEMYLKVRLEDARPRCKLYSVHQALHGITKKTPRKARTKD